MRSLDEKHLKKCYSDLFSKRLRSGLLDRISYDPRCHDCRSQHILHGLIYEFAVLCLHHLLDAVCLAASLVLILVHVLIQNLRKKRRRRSRVFDLAGPRKPA